MSNSQSISVTGWKRWRFRLEAFGVRLLTVIVPVLPRGFVWRAGAAGGWLAYYVVPLFRKIARANLDFVYGNKLSLAERNRIARISCQNFATTLLTFFWAPRLDRQSLAKIVTLEETGLQLARKYQAEKRPIILITMHYGDWELLGLATGLYGIPMTIPTRTMRNTTIEQIFAELRSRTGNRIISRNHAAGKLLKTLQRSGAIALLIDQHVPDTLGGIRCEFFGVPVLTTPAAAQLALHSGAVILGSVARPLPGGRLQITYGPEINTTSTGDKTADVQAITQRCLDFCERTIREQPEYWLWSYKRWKHRPADCNVQFPSYP